MKKLFILLIVPLSTFGQVQHFAVTGEYQGGLGILSTGVYNSTGVGGAVGNANPPVNGKPGLLIPPQFSTGASTRWIIGGSSALHSQHIFDSAGNLYFTGINDNHSAGLGSVGNQSQFVQITVDNRGNAFGNVAGVWDGANTSGSFCLAWKRDGTLWGAGLLDQGLTGNGSSPSADSTFFIPITGFSAGDTVIDAKGGVILEVLTRNGSTYSVYTSGTSSSFTGNSTSDGVLHKLTTTGYTPKQIDLGVLWCGILGTDGNLRGWGFNYQTWCGTLGSAPTTPTNVMTNIGMTAGSIASFAFGDICTYSIDNTGKFFGWGDDVLSGLGLLAKIDWNNYGTPPPYGATKFPWAWDQNQIPSPLENGVIQAHLLDSCHTYLAVWAGHSFGAYTFAEQAVTHFMVAAGRNKGGVQANGVYDQQYVNGNPESLYPNSYDSASRDLRLGWFMIFPWNDVAGVARHSPRCDAVPTATYCSLYTPEGESPPVITGFNNQTITTNSYTYSGISIAGQSGHSIHNIRMTEITAGACPTSSNSTPYAATTTFSNLSAGVHTIQLTATDDQYKQTTATATITVGCVGCFYLNGAGGAKFNFVTH